MSRTRIAPAIVALAIAAISCDIAFEVPVGSQFPTAAPGVFETVVAGTAHAAQTQTALLIPPSTTPTFTPTVTRTATGLPSFTPTFIFQLRSPVPTRGNTATPTFGSTSGNLGCALVSQKPADGKVFKPNAKFDAVWEVRNTGSASWSADDVNFVYATGRQMHENDSYDLPRDVPSGGTVELTVAMTAPKITGEFKTVWTLQRGKNDFCHVDLTIAVE
jgi:hypothetical protein